MTGVDASEDQLRVAHERAPRTELIHADATALPFPDKTFDAGATPSGWRAPLGSFVHLPLEPFLNSFAGFTLDRTEEPDDGREDPATFAVALTKP